MDESIRRQLAAARRHARRPLLFVLLVAVLSVAVALLLPRWYRARAVLLPPQEGATPYGVLAGLIESSALSRVGLIATASPSDTYVEILKSRTVREAAIRKLDLQRRYKEPNLDRCLEALDSHVRVGVMQSRAIELTAEDRDPAFSARLANELVANLDSVNIRLQKDKATKTAAFLAEQLRNSADQLREAQARLTAYEREHGVFAGPEQSGVAGVADLVASRLALQVRRSWLASYSAPDSPALRAIDAELAAIEQQLARLPGLKQEGSRLALEVEIQRRVYTLLTAQLEESQMQGRSSLSTVSVLDPARAPTRPSRPRRALIVLVATGLALVGAAAWLARRVRAEAGTPGGHDA